MSSKAQTNRVKASGQLERQVSSGASRRAPKDWVYRPVSHVTKTRLATPRSIRSRQSHGEAPAKVVKVKPSQEKRPFSCYKKYRDMGVGERPPDPYFTPWEKHIKSEIHSRKKWVGPTFVVTDHKATVARREREMAGSSCVAAGGPYKNPGDAFRDEDKSKFIGPRGFI